MIPEGLPYILAADIKARERNKLLQNSVLISLVFTFCFLLPIIPAFQIYKNMVRKREEELEQQLYYDAT